MRKFMNLMENINDFSVQAEIDKRLQAFDHEDRILIHDGLEIIHMAGASGIAVSDWVNQMRGLNGHAYDTQKLRTIFRAMIDTFSEYITRTSTSVYAWQMPLAPMAMPDQKHDDLDTTSPEAQAAHMQIALTGEILNVMKNSIRFTPEDIAAKITSVPHATAEFLVHHVIDTMHSSIIPDGDGYYKMKPDAPKTGSMELLRGLAARGIQPGDDTSDL